MTTTNSKMMETALRVLQKMAHLGVMPLPRNYEVFYSAMTGSIPKLGGALMMLGPNPTQQDIDDVAVKFFPDRAAENATSKMTGTMGRELNALGATLDNEQKSLRAFGGAVEAAKNSLMVATQTGAATPEKVIEFMDVVINALSSRQAQGDQVAARVNDSTGKLQQLEREVAHYRQLANTDTLSRLHNRRAFDDRLASIYDKPNYEGMALLVMDIDRFKHINDNYGHPVGDMVIANVAERIKAVVRKGTFVARTGGEEFAVIIEPGERGDPGLNQATLAQIAERIRQGVEGLALTIPKTTTPIGKVTVSIGVCPAVDALSPGDLYQKADAALYKAKEQGRNRVVFHPKPHQAEPEEEVDHSDRYMMYGRR